ncbi:MAG: hypothetical protein FJZ57_06030 [Chlamydiae bacterium]|nr:hypothetical protein [Chlamydiota bacterium]
MKKKKRSLTLIEIIIALAITGMLISFLWQSYFNCQKQLVSLESNKKSYVDKILLQETISSIVTRLTSNKNTAAIHTPKCDISLPKILMLYADAQIDLDTDLSGPCYFGIGQSEDKLIMTQWGANEKKRVTLLVNGIQNVDFLFYDVASSSWVDFWDKKNKKTPLMIKIRIDNSEKKEFVFFPQLNIEPIKYISSS